MARTTTAGAPVGDTVVSFLRGAVERHGPRDALLFKPAFRYLRWSYSRLWKESGQVATLLQRRGLVKGDQVILWGPNSPHWALIMFGCMRAGIIVVPLDLRSAPDYVERVVSKTTPKLAFTSRFTPKGEVELGVPEIAFEDLGSGHRRFARTGGRAHRSGRPCRDYVHVRHYWATPRES